MYFILDQTTGDILKKHADDIKEYIKDDKKHFTDDILTKHKEDIKGYFKEDLENYLKTDNVIFKHDHSLMKDSLKSLNDSSGKILERTYSVPQDIVNFLSLSNINAEEREKIEIEVKNRLQNIINEINEFVEKERGYIEEFEKLKERDRLLINELNLKFNSLEEDIRIIFIEEKNELSEFNNQTRQNVQKFYSHCNDLLEKINNTYEEYESNSDRNRYLTAESIAESLADELFSILKSKLN